jgi:hypothetical protein
MIKEITKTVYSMCLPESKYIFDQILDNDRIALHDMYSETFTKKQDPYHVSYLNAFKDWSNPVLDVNWDNLKHSYPCAGASEAIREQIAHLKSIGKDIMYIFDGEYEGYEAIAKPLGFEVVKITREQYAEFEYLENSVFFMSNPSSIDGNLWLGFEKFMEFMNSKNKMVDLYIDVTYLGAIPFDFKINLQYENVKGLFFSLSKSFGVYYHRIGGCFLKEENPLLYGNMWFKNLLAMKYGESLMNKLTIVELAKKHSHYQDKAIQYLKEKYKIQNIDKSDVFLLANINVKDEILANGNNDYLDYIANDLSRGNKAVVRVCLTPIVEKMLSDDLMNAIKW